MAHSLVLVAAARHEHQVGNGVLSQQLVKISLQVLLLAPEVRSQVDSAHFEYESDIRCDLPSSDLEDGLSL